MTPNPTDSITCQACNGRGERNTVDHDTIRCSSCDGRGWTRPTKPVTTTTSVDMRVMVDSLMQHASTAFILGQDAKAKRLREIALELRNLDLEGQR